MSSGIAHGLSNSLTPIIGYSDFLLETESGNSEQSAKCLRAIRSAAGDIALVVERIRQFYRIRNPEEPLTLVDLNTLVKQVVDSVQPKWQELAQRRGILISIETRLDREPPLVLESEAELRDTVNQLVSNAIEAMPKGGTLSLTTRSLQPDANAAPTWRGQSMLEVRDTGVGMDAAQRERCFEPFFSTKGSRGCGLGLAVVYGMMRRHGGSIEMDTDPGKGTAIRLYFHSGDAVAPCANGTGAGALPRKACWETVPPAVAHP
jgi:signal transduction histidine kinase